MSSAALAHPKVGSRLHWLVLILLVVSVCINYVDRGNLSVAAASLSDALHLRPSQLGLLLSAFFWSYAGFMVLAGWMIDRYNVIWVYAAGYLIWSASTLFTGLIYGFSALFALRLVLGMSESVAYPSYSKIIASVFPEHERGIANGLIDAGSKMGPALGLLIGGSILAHFGWRALFLSIGAVSLLWLLPWCLTAPRLHADTFTKCEGGPGFLEIMGRRDAWGTFLCLFCANYAWYFLLTWLPWYLQKVRHYSAEDMAIFGSLPFWAVAGGAVFSGWAADVLIRRGGGVTFVRKAFVGGGLVACAVFLLPSALATDKTVAMVLLMLASFCLGLFSGNHWAITQTLAGATAAGKWTGLQNCAGNLAGVVVPIVTGNIVEKTGSFFYAFVCVCVSLLISSFSYFWIVGQIRTVTWKTPGNISLYPK